MGLFNWFSASKPAESAGAEDVVSQRVLHKDQVLDVLADDVGSAEKLLWFEKKMDEMAFQANLLALNSGSSGSRLGAGL